MVLINGDSGVTFITKNKHTMFSMNSSSPFMPLLSECSWGYSCSLSMDSHAYSCDPCVHDIKVIMIAVSLCTNLSNIVLLHLYNNSFSVYT